MAASTAVAALQAQMDKEVEAVQKLNSGASLCNLAVFRRVDMDKRAHLWSEADAVHRHCCRREQPAAVRRAAAGEHAREAGEGPISTKASRARLPSGPLGLLRHSRPPHPTQPHWPRPPSCPESRPWSY